MTNYIVINFSPQVKSMAISVHMQNPFIQLKKIVNHPYLVQMPLIPGENKLRVDENIIKVSGKFQLLEAMLTKLKILGHKVIYLYLRYNTLKSLMLNNVSIIINIQHFIIKNASLKNIELAQQ